MNRRGGRHSRKRGGSPLMTAATVICVAVFLLSAGMLIRYWAEYAEGDALYDELGRARTESTPVPAPSGASGGPGLPPEPSVTAEPPGPEAIAGMEIDFEALLAINPDVVGWLYCPDTVIDYPVVRGKDNSYYLHHLYDGTPNSNGSIFMDYRSSADFTDINTLVYGHHMKSGKMFAGLEGYKKQAYYDAHPALYLFTPAGNYEIQVFAGIIQSGQLPPLPVSFSDEKSYTDLITGLMSKSTFSSDAAVPVFSPLITLVTCTYDYSDARYYLAGKLVKVGQWQQAAG